MRLMVAVLVLALASPACGIVRRDRDLPAVAPMEGPIPVDGGGGIGGEVPEGPIDVTATIIVDGERAEVVDICALVDTGAYRVTLDPGVLRISDGPDESSATYEVDGRTFAGAVQPIRAETSLTIQGSLIEAGTEQALFFDATIPTTDLPDCDDA